MTSINNPILIVFVLGIKLISHEKVDVNFDTAHQYSNSQI